LRKFNNKPKEHGLSVIVKEGEYFEKALRRFKKKVDNSGILQDVREKQHYEQPSQVRKKAKAAARARWLKKVQKDTLPPKRY